MHRIRTSPSMPAVGSPAALDHAPELALDGPHAAERTQAPRRVDAVDIYRGLIMVLMVLDHTRERVHLAGMTENATDPATSTPLLYLTRWLTHFCAPGFVLLAGLSVGLMRQRGLSARQLSRYLVTRGLFLIALEIVVIRPLVFMNVNPMLFAFLETIWAIGFSMMVLALLVHLPDRVRLAVGLLIVFGHNALDGVRVAPWGGPSSPMPPLLHKVWMLLHQGGLFPISLYPVESLPGPLVLVGYPVLPWIGVMALGYCMAALYSDHSARRTRTFIAIGTAMLALFLVLRLFNIYGDATPWQVQQTVTQTVFSFFNLQKYPPSLLFLLATLAPCLFALALLDTRRLTSPLARWLRTIGRVPMFFFLLQWLWVHVAGVLTNLVYGQPLAGQFASLTDYMFGPQPPPSGGPLWLVYPAWFLGAVLLYFPCRWYARVRERRRDVWLLRYL